LKSSLKVKITLWFIVIIIIAFILYGSLIFTVFRFNLREEKFIHSLRDNPEIGRAIVDRIAEINRREKGFRFFPPIAILTAGLLWRVFSIISGGVLLIIIVSTSGGFLFLRRSLNQINTITNNVKEIDEKKLHIRLNLKGNDAISKMAKTFDSMLDKIENSFNQQKQFIQNASHELNTPLTIIKTKIDVLKLNKNITKREYEETLQLINNEIVRLSKITDNLLLLSSLEDISKQNQFEQVDIKKIIQKVLALFRNTI
jgi:signal transduction histidine kinase